MSINLDADEIKDSLKLACAWLTDRAMAHEDRVSHGVNKWQYNFTSWQGALREYDAAERQWIAYGPMWHTGQAVKALVLASRALGDKCLLEFARKGAEFILRERIKDPKDQDFGALLAYEGDEGPGALIANISGMLETLDGLMLLGDETKDNKYWDAALACLDWVERRAFLADEGLFYDRFSLKDRSIGPMPYILDCGFSGRPLLDDGVFLKAFQKIGKDSFREIFFKTADRLLKEEFPPGNWIKFPPASIEHGWIHPRHAFWWGRPMIMGWKEAQRRGDIGGEDYQQCSLRSAEWYVNAQRKDGGFFRHTYLDFKTDSFGHATSGILSACSLWRDLIVEGVGDAYRQPFRLALAFALSMQFTRAVDPNLNGAILEKVNHPNGADNILYNIRDLGTIFYVQVVSMALLDELL